MPKRQTFYSLHEKQISEIYVLYILVVQFTPKNIIDVVTNLKGNTSSGHDKIDSCVVKRCIHLITLPLSYIFNASFEQGTFPKDFKLAKVIPVYKKGGIFFLFSIDLFLSCLFFFQKYFRNWFITD